MKLVYGFAAAAVCAACASGTVATVPSPAPARVPAEAATRPALPPIPPADGPLRIRVMYPDSGVALASRDSNFIFGSLGSGKATLTINGAPVTVAPNGAFLAYIPVPADGQYRINAAKGSETASYVRLVKPQPAPGTTSRTRIISVSPSGAIAVPRGATMDVSMRGTSGGNASLVLADGTRYTLVENRNYTDDAAAGADFQTAPPASSTAARTLSTYNGVVQVRNSWVASDTTVPRGGLAARRLADVDDTAREKLAAAAAAGVRVDSMQSRNAAATRAPRGAYFELIVGGDTVRTPARINLTAISPDYPIVGIVQAPAGAASDWRTRGRVDTSGPFHYFWPSGTRLQIIGERDGFFQVRLANNKSAFVPQSDMRLLPAGTPVPGSAVASVRFVAQPGYIDLRIPVSEQLPFQVNESERSISIDVFGAMSRVNYFQYGTLDPLIERAEWSEPTDSVYRVTVNLTRYVWGYDTFYDNTGSLVLRIRRPPVIDPAAPLKGLLIAVDPGHPPGGAIGPTGLTEAQANLGLALKFRDLLTAAGARVLMTRSDSSSVALDARPRMAADSNAYILISMHNNAFPDGVNPFTNNGTSAYYFHPQSAQLARLLQGELLAALGLRDIGIGRADLALVRTTWMPAVLTETSFLMIPEQEAAMRNPDVQERVARAHLRGLEAFLRERAH